MRRAGTGSNARGMARRPTPYAPRLKTLTRWRRTNSVTRWGLHIRKASTSTKAPSAQQWQPPMPGATTPSPEQRCADEEMRNIIPGVFALTVVAVVATLGIIVLRPPSGQVPGEGAGGCSSESVYDWEITDEGQGLAATAGGAIARELELAESEIVDFSSRRTISPSVADEIVRRKAEIVALSDVEPVEERTGSSVEEGIASRTVYRTAPDAAAWAEVVVVQPEGTSGWLLERTAWSLPESVCDDARSERDAVDRPDRERPRPGAPARTDG